MLNLAEVWERNNHQASIVVDFGTAVVVSAVDNSGTVCGVAIAPGITTAMKSLTSATAQLPPIPLQLPSRVMGRDTVGALQSGILYGYCGLVGKLINGFQKELHGSTASSRTPPLAPVIATGGDGKIIWQHISQIDSYDRELTLYGLLRLGQMNS